MKATISYRVEVDSLEALTAARQRGHETLDDHAKVVASNSAVDEQLYTVIGSVKGKPDETWREVVNASDAQAAADKATRLDNKRTVTGVLEGDVAVEQPYGPGWPD